jgi:lipopolysaccharide/colanic/teichoic acid biosynthesis glycosyltransferase
MYVQDTKEIQMTRKNDVRITPIGRIIRKTHLDELPQLINILKGDMSIVGPRPEMVELYDMYAEKYPEFHYRSKVKAGLTGYAQVYGKYNTSPHDKIKFDLIYIANFSLLLDLKLILLTVKVMFKEKTSEGIEQNEKTSLK